MDMAETIRKLALAAGTVGQLSVDTFKELVPLDVTAEEVERLIDTLDAQGI